MHEIIHIVDSHPLCAGARRDPEVEALADRPLAAGYYFALRPGRKGAAKKRGKRYFGPLRTANEARLLLTSAIMLGLAEEAQARPALVQYRSIMRNATAANDGYSPRRSVQRQAAGRVS